MELSEETKREVVEFQNLQQQLQIVLLQRQQMQLRLAEIGKVSEELGKAGSDAKFYRSVGSVLVPKDKKGLEADLAQEKETLDNRTSLLGKQEEKITQRLSALQEKFRKLEQGFSLGTGGEGGTIKAGKGR